MYSKQNDVISYYLDTVIFIILFVTMIMWKKEGRGHLKHERTRVLSDGNAKVL